MVAVLELFLELAGPEHTRMRHLLVDVPQAEFLARLAGRLPFQPVSIWQRSVSNEVLHIGAHPQAQAGHVYVGGVPPLGRLDSTMLRGAARLAQEYGDATLRFTPWQSLLLPNIHHDNADEVIRLSLIHI